MHEIFAFIKCNAIVIIAWQINNPIWDEYTYSEGVLTFQSIDCIFIFLKHGCNGNRFISVWTRFIFISFDILTIWFNNVVFFSSSIDFQYVIHKLSWNLEKSNILIRFGDIQWKMYGVWCTGTTRSLKWKCYRIVKR